MTSADTPAVDAALPLSPAEPAALPLDPSIRQPNVRLLLISFFLLFLELASIRWFGSTVVFLTFFTNIVLVASFLGMSVGLMTASRKTDFINWTLPTLAITYNRPMYIHRDNRPMYACLGISLEKIA